MDKNNILVDGSIDPMMFWIQLTFVITVIFIGARLRGVGLGIMGGFGLVILTFIFHVKPDAPPYDVLLVIIGGVTASMALEAAGGLEYLTKLAEKIIRKHPNQITIVGPLVGYIFTLLTGTSHVTYSILPIISDVAIGAGVRPERPLSATAVSSLQAIVASPISAATAITVTLLGSQGITFFNLLKVTLPATLAGVFASIVVASKIGKDLNKDSEIIKRLKESEKENMSSLSKTTSLKERKSRAKLSVFIFLIGVLAIVLTSIPSLTPTWIIKGQRVALPGPSKVAMIMLGVASLIVLICKARTYDMIRGKVAIAGMQAVIAILGVSWLGKTLFMSHLEYIKQLVSSIISVAPWMFAFFLFFTTVISTSQAATLRILFPLGIAIGMSASTLVGFLPAINAVFFIPGYPTMVAAMEFDKTGSTRVGKYVLNHSFMLPGLAGGITSIFTCMVLAKCLL